MLRMTSHARLAFQGFNTKTCQLNTNYNQQQRATCHRMGRVIQGLTIVQAPGICLRVQHVLPKQILCLNMFVNKGNNHRYFTLELMRPSSKALSSLTIVQGLL